MSEVEKEITDVQPRFDGARRGTETILLVEEDEAVRALARRILEHGGYTTLTARNGVEASEVIERSACDVRLAIMDVVMPEMGGREAYELMRKVRPDLKFMFASGYSAGGIHTDFALDNSLNVLQKLFAPAVLLHAVRSAVDVLVP